MCLCVNFILCKIEHVFWNVFLNLITRSVFCCFPEFDFPLLTDNERIGHTCFYDKSPFRVYKKNHRVQNSGSLSTSALRPKISPRGCVSSTPKGG